MVYDIADNPNGFVRACAVSASTAGIMSTSGCTFVVYAIARFLKTVWWCGWRQIFNHRCTGYRANWVHASLYGFTPLPRWGALPRGKLHKEFGLVRSRGRRWRCSSVSIDKRGPH